MSNIRDQYNNRYIKVKAVKTTSSSNPKRTIVSKYRNDPYLWYMIKEKKVDLYKDLGIRIID